MVDHKMLLPNSTAKLKCSSSTFWTIPGVWVGLEAISVCWTGVLARWYCVKLTGSLPFRSVLTEIAGIKEPKIAWTEEKRMDVYEWTAKQAEVHEADRTQVESSVPLLPWKWRHHYLRAGYLLLCSLFLAWKLLLPWNPFLPFWNWSCRMRLLLWMSAHACSFSSSSTICSLYFLSHIPSLLSGVCGLLAGLESIVTAGIQNEQEKVTDSSI